MSLVQNLLRKKQTFEVKKPTALCFFYDGKFDNELAELGINLIGPHELSVYDWDSFLKHRRLPRVKHVGSVRCV